MKFDTKPLGVFKVCEAGEYIGIPAGMSSTGTGAIITHQLNLVSLK